MRLDGDSLIAEAHLLRPVHYLRRWDVLPFVLLYAALFGLMFYVSEVGGEAVSTVAFVALPICLTVQMLLFLVSQWSVALEAALGFVVVNKWSDGAQYVHVLAAPNAGKDRIVPLLMRSSKAADGSFVLLGAQHESHKLFFEFQKVTYNLNLLNPSATAIERLEYPIAARAADFLSDVGLDMPTAQRSAFKWGFNEFDIPMPAFLDLYVEHLVAPFFVFQMLCLLLWSLDDYWYYSLFTAFMLMFFEGMLCRQRQASLAQLRNMRRASTGVQVVRNGEWHVIPSEMLVPGDIISVAVAEQRGGGKGLFGRGKAGGSGGGSGEEDEGEDSDVLPCDALLLKGSCVVNEAILTGESVPQIKESLWRADNMSPDLRVDLAEGNAAAASFRRHLLLGGTRIIQTEYRDDDKDGGAAGSKTPPPPNRGCVAVVVRTGFGTEQGNLMRKILFATERVNATSTETFYFIAVLVLFALVAAATVLHSGLQEEERNKFKLFLHCIMIVTSVVPPELPMELSLAVTNSLGALNQHLIFCTEPFRIPFAGKLDVLCFDKTGTLTKDEMILRGLVGAAHAPKSLFLGDDGSSSSPAAAAGEAIIEVVSPSSASGGGEGEIPDVVLCVMAACNTLHRGASGDTIGDPLEAAAFAASGFDVSSAAGSGAAEKGSIGFSVVTHAERGLRVTLRHRFQFSSTLKRMSVVVDVQAQAQGQSSSWVLTKGAPEVLESRMANVPAFFRPTYLHHMRGGKRVLVLAGRRLSSSEATSLRSSPRDEAEKGLQFLAFLVFDSDLKVDTKSVVRDLRNSNHKVVMITGDSAYTAADIGRKIGLLKKATERPLLYLQLISAGSSSGAGGKVVWRSETADDAGFGPCAGDVAFSEATLSRLAQTSCFCVTGPALQHLRTDLGVEPYRLLLAKLAPTVEMFARMSPAQKEEVVTALNSSGLHTLMCGDGTNDVGALKAAHVGVSIINDPRFERLIEASSSSSSSSAAATAVGAGGKKPKGSSQKERMARAMKELEAQEQDPTIVKLGDASIASPFTARRTSIDSVLTVVRQGRCTLVTTTQVFKILALNCLVSAYMMSALYLIGLKQGDMQMTASGLVTAGLFFFLSQAKPLAQLAPARPPSSVFAASISVSIVGQFVIHLASLLATLRLCQQYTSPDDSTLAMDGKFQPNVINSAMFLLSVAMQINNFVVNYRGHPFTQSIQDNFLLWRSVQVIYLALLVLAGGQFEPLNDLLQMSPFPSANFQAYLLLILLANFSLSYTVERLSRRLE